jgi:hypothetical protein
MLFNNYVIFNEFCYQLKLLYLFLIHPVYNTNCHNLLIFVHDQNLTILTYDFVPLVYMISARKQDATSDHLPHDAPDAPYVDVFRVSHTQDNFRGSVIPGDHVRCHHERGASSTRQAEI